MTEPPSPEDAVDYPPLLESILRKALSVLFMIVLLLPFVASVLARVEPGLPILDAGASTAWSRFILHITVLLSGVFLLLLPQTASRHNFVRRAPGLLLALFIAAVTISALLSVCVWDSVQSLVAWLVAAVFFAVSREVSRTRSEFRLAVHCVLILGTLVALVGLAIYVEAVQSSEAAFTGAFYQADVAAGFLLLLIPLAVALLVGARTSFQRVLYTALALLLTVSLILTYSRGGLIAAGVGLVVVSALMLRARGLPAILLPLGVVAISFLAAGLLSSGGQSLVPHRAVSRSADLLKAAFERPTTSLAERSGQEADSSVTARLNFYRGGFRMAVARPLFGWGPATFGRVFPRFQTDVRFYSKYAHSAYVTVLSEGGFVGLACLLLFLVVLFVAGGVQYASAIKLGGWSAAAVSGLLAALTAAAVHVVVDVDWEFHMLRVLFFGLAGLLLSAGAVQMHDGEDAGVFVSHRRMLRQWALCVPLMGIMVLPVFPFCAYRNDAVASLARDNGKVEIAVEAERQALSCDPYSAASWRQLCEFLLTWNDSGAHRPHLLQEAVAAARRCVDLDPYRAINHDMLTRALIAAGDHSGALASEREAIGCDPVNYPKFYNVIAELLVQGNQDAAAFDLLTSIASRYPPEVFPTMWYFRRDSLYAQLSHTWHLIGTMEQRRGHPGEARRAYARAVEMNPKSIVARFQLGTLMMNEGQPGLAFEQFRAIQQLKPRHGVSKWIMGLCYRELGQYGRAYRLLDEAWKEYPGLREGSEKIPIPNDFFTVAPKSSVPTSPIVREPQG